MKFTATWNILQNKWLPLCKRWGSMSPQERANAGSGVKIVGRWGDMVARTGVEIFGSDDLASVQTLPCAPIFSGLAGGMSAQSGKRDKGAQYAFPTLARDGSRGGVRDGRVSDVLALRPHQREPAARRATLRVTISQKRWPPPLRPLQSRVLGFQDQAGRAARTVHSRNGTRPPARRRSGRIRAQRSFRPACSVSSRAWPYGWHDRAGWLPPRRHLLLLYPAHRAPVYGNPSFVLISSPRTLSPRSSDSPDRQKAAMGIGRPRPIAPSRR